MISLKVNALLCTLQHIVTRAMQLSCVNSENFSPNIFLQVFHEKTGPSLTAYYERIYKQIPRRPTSLRRDGVWLAVRQSASVRFINNPFTIKKSESGVRYLQRGLWVPYYMKQQWTVVCIWESLRNSTQNWRPMNASTPSFNRMERLVTLLASHCLEFTTFSQKNEMSLKVCGRRDRRICPLAPFICGGNLRVKVYANNP